MSTRSGVGRQVRASRAGSAETTSEPIWLAVAENGARARLVSLRPSRDGHWGALGDVAVVSVWPAGPQLCLWIAWLRGSCSCLSSRHMHAGRERNSLPPSVPGPRDAWFRGRPAWASSGALSTLSSCRDGAPYCEKDYQGLFGVKCEACHQFITGKVLEVSDGRAALTASFPSEALGPAGESAFPFFLTGGGEKVVDDQPLRG